MLAQKQKTVKLYLSTRGCYNRPQRAKCGRTTGTNKDLQLVFQVSAVYFISDNKNAAAIQKFSE